MKRDKTIYWISTALISLMMLFAALSYFTSPMAKDGFARLGFPDYFRIELGIAKLLGVIAISLPWIPGKIKEFAYAGFTITFISAFTAHVSSGDPLTVAMNPVIALIILAVSYIYYLKNTKSGII
jgi:hypothetical protein